MSDSLSKKTRQHHFIDKVHACLKAPAGFQLTHISTPSPHDGRCVIYLMGHDKHGSNKTIGYYFHLPRPTQIGKLKPTVEFIESLQRGIDATAEEARKYLCRHYAQHAESGKSGNSP